MSPSCEVLLLVSIRDMATGERTATEIAWIVMPALRGLLSERQRFELVENTIRTYHMVLGTILRAQDKKRLAEASSERPLKQCGASDGKSKITAGALKCSKW